MEVPKWGEQMEIVLYPEGVRPLLRFTMPYFQQNTTAEQMQKQRPERTWESMLRLCQGRFYDSMLKVCLEKIWTVERWKAMDAAGLWWASDNGQIQHLIFGLCPNWERKICVLFLQSILQWQEKCSMVLLYTAPPGLISNRGLTIQAIRCNFSFLPVNRLVKYTLASIAIILSTSNS